MSIRDWIPRFAALPDRSLATLEADNARLMAANAELARQLDVVSRERDELIAADSEALAHALAELDGVRKERDKFRDWHEGQVKRTVKLSNAMHEIKRQGEASKNGTARKQGRIAREALE